MTGRLNNEQLLTTADVAQILKIRPNTIEISRCKGIGINIPYMKIGSRIRYKFSDVQEYMENNKIIGGKYE